METIRDIRIRLKSINSTKQITESMRMISTRKVQKTKQRMADNRMYAQKSAEIIKNMVTVEQFGSHSYIAGHDKGKPLIIVITGDRGLCGGYNVNAEKEAAALAQKIGADGEAEFITIGTKGRDYFRRRKRTINHSFRGLSENPFYKDAQNIGNIALKMYNEQSASQVYVVYTKYQSMLSQTPESKQLLPLNLEISKTDNVREELNFETDAGALFGYAVSSYVHSMIFGAMLESAVCEQCSRLTSMDSAVKNSEKIIDALKLQYNQMRQSAITQEIAEIVGGANAVKKD